MAVTAAATGATATVVCGCIVVTGDEFTADVADLVAATACDVVAGFSVIKGGAAEGAATTAFAAGWSNVVVDGVVAGAAGEAGEASTGTNAERRSSSEELAAAA